MTLSPFNLLNNSTMVLGFGFWVLGSGLLVIGYWLLVVGCWLLVGLLDNELRPSLFVNRYSSFLFIIANFDKRKLNFEW